MSSRALGLQFLRKMGVYLRSFILFASILLAGLGASAHPGYLSEVSGERESRFYEVFLFAAPPLKVRPLQEVIFNETLSKEFKDKYRERFGGLDAESIVYQQANFSVLDQNKGAVLQVEQGQGKRKAFGEYMVKRLIEWHVDNYFKTDPTMRPVYELKEKISNLEVQVNKSTKVNIRYNFSDNTSDLICENPYFDSSKLSLIMDSKAFGPGPLLEEKLIVEKQLNRKYRVNTSALSVDGIAAFEVIRSLSATWSTNFLTSAAFKGGGTSSRETRYIVGLSHAY
jgi:hypothetical protein